MLGAVALAPALMHRPPARDHAGGAEVVQIHLTAGPDHVTIKPGETAELAAGPIYVTLEFTRLIDPSSVHVAVSPETWHLLPWITPDASSEYQFVIRPDPGVDGRVSLTIDGAKTPEGDALLQKPISIDVKTSPVTQEAAALDHPLTDLIQNAVRVSVETMGRPASMTEFVGAERDWLVQAAQSAAGRAEIDLGHGTGPIADYQMAIETGTTTYWVRWQSTQWFTVTWTEKGRRKVAGFAQSDERLINAISEVLAARQRGTGLH
jgi:hypothetical protein